MSGPETSSAKKNGRPPAYKPEYAEQAEKLCQLGATDQEIADFFEVMPSEDDWLFVCLLLIRQDRSGKGSKRSRDRAQANRSRIAANPSQRIRKNVTARIWASLKGSRDGALFSRLGYSVGEMRAHLEGLFSPGMTWANYGKWHVDHIKPCALFDLTDEAQFAECWSLTNLQPLWASANLSKGARYVGA